MIIDFNAHFGQGPGTIDWCGAEKLARLEKAAGIDLAVASDIGAAFAHAAMSPETLPDGLVAFASLAPTFDRRLPTSIKGVRIYPTYHVWDFGGAACSDLLALARERNLIVQVYLRLQDLRVLLVAFEPADVIERLPKLVDAHQDIRFVISGATYAEVNANPALFGRENIWTDISHVQHPINSLPKLLDAIDVSRVLFGTGAPVLYPYSNVFRVVNSPISDEIKERILWRNARELL
jgi:hypothetical protein